MKRHHLLVIVGVAILVAGIMSPLFLTTDQNECIEPYVDDDGGMACTETVEKKQPNIFRLPMISVGFVVSIVGVSIWGMDE